LAGKTTLTSSKNKQIVFFDWNGTFIDDEVATVEAFREVLRGVKHPKATLSIEELSALHAEVFEIPLSKMYDKIGFSDEQKRLAAEEHYWAESYNKAVASIKTHTGILETIEILENHGIDFGILSNHTASDIEAKLLSFGFSDIPILANDHSGQSHIQGKLHRIEKYQTSNPYIEVIAIIGDSVEEVEIAKSIKSISIAFSNGWVRENRIKSANPDYLIDSSELPSVITTIVSA
jgi:phosphoglycolate phosphatase-like HAD superfamily hydrolase